MGQLSRVLRSIAGGGLGFFCPGCREMHVVWTGEGPWPRPRWSWNGDAEKPVFWPSLLVTGHFETADTRCHTFVGCNGAQPGQIIFLGDCTHELAGRTVDLPDVPAMRYVKAD